MPPLAPGMMTSPLAYTLPGAAGAYPPSDPALEASRYLAHWFHSHFSSSAPAIAPIPAPLTITIPPDAGGLVNGPAAQAMNHSLDALNRTGDAVVQSFSSPAASVPAPDTGTIGGAFHHAADAMLSVGKTALDAVTSAVTHLTPLVTHLDPTMVAFGAIATGTVVAASYLGYKMLRNRAPQTNAPEPDKPRRKSGWLKKIKTAGILGAVGAATQFVFHNPWWVIPAAAAGLYAAKELVNRATAPREPRAPNPDYRPAPAARGALVPA